MIIRRFCMVVAFIATMSVWQCWILHWCGGERVDLKIWHHFTQSQSSFSPILSMWGTIWSSNSELVMTATEYKLVHCVVMNSEYWCVLPPKNRILGGSTIIGYYGCIDKDADFLSVHSGMWFVLGADCMWWACQWCTSNCDCWGVLCFQKYSAWLSWPVCKGDFFSISKTISFHLETLSEICPKWLERE